MITYKATYKVDPDGVHAEVLDFPGTITCADSLDEARRLLASALVDMAETNFLRGEPLPTPNPQAHDPEADIEEPIYLTPDRRLESNYGARDDAHMKRCRRTR